MLKMMYCCTLFNRSERRCPDILEINENFLNWHRANLSGAPQSSGYTLFPAPPPCPPAAYLHPAYPAPPMLMPPQNKPLEILSKAENNHDNAHAEPQQPSNLNHMRSPPTIMLPERQFYPRHILPLPEEPFRKYMPFSQPSYPEPMAAMFDNANYNVIDGRELRPEPRPHSNFVLVNREQQRKIEQIWPPVNKAVFEGVTNVMQPFSSNAREMFGPGDQQAVVGADRLADWSSAYSRAEEMFGPGDRQAVAGADLLVDQSSAYSRAEKMFGPGDRQAVAGADLLVDRSSAYSRAEKMFGPGDRLAVVGADRLADRSSAYSRADEQELEEELEALARRFDMEFNSTD